MKIDIECLTCFSKQAEQILRKFVGDKERRLVLMREVLGRVGEFHGGMIPLELSPFVYHFLSEQLGVEDLYREEKELTNEKALALEPFIQLILSEATEPFTAGIKLSIIGNIMDYGLDAVRHIDLEAFIIEYMKKELLYNEQEAFTSELGRHKRLIYLTDNSGEIIFDRVWLSFLKERFPSLEIVVAAKESPILNDVTYLEVKSLGFEKLGQVISTGSRLPGNMEKYFSKDFLEVWKGPAVVLAKGQGNFEGMWDNPRKIYFAFMAKCPFLASEIKVPLYSMLFRSNHP